MSMILPAVLMGQSRLRSGRNSLLKLTDFSLFWAEGEVGEIVSLNWLTSPYFELKEKWEKCLLKLTDFSLFELREKWEK